MKTIYLLFLTLFLMSSCGSTKKLEVDNIKTVYLEHNAMLPLQFGGTIEGEIIALLKDGEEIEVTKNRNLAFLSNDLQQQGKNFKIVKHPNSFDDNTVLVQYTITEKEAVATFTDSIKLNLRGDLKIDAKALSGVDGVSQKDRNVAVIFRDGNDGDNGTPGTDGQSAEDYVTYIWKEGSAYFIYVQNIQTKAEWRYKSLEPGTISIDVSGGNGGDGGDGGDGAKGKNGKKNGDKLKTPGNGGDAGFGGNAGNGGNAGSVICFLHTNAAELELKISFNVSAGVGGQGGEKGNPGKPGTPLEGQLESLAGRKGRDGRDGFRGNDGQMPQVTIQEFDFSGYK